MKGLVQVSHEKKYDLAFTQIAPEKKNVWETFAHCLSFWEVKAYFQNFCCSFQGKYMKMNSWLVKVPGS